MEERSDMYLHEEQPPIKNLKGTRQTSCKKLEFCVRKEPGKSAFFMQENFAALWKPFLIPKTERRKKGSKEAKPKKAPKPPARIEMERANMVFCFRTGMPEAGTGDSGWGLHLNALCDDVSFLQGGQMTEHWFDVGYMNYSTLRFSGCCLKRRDGCISQTSSDPGLIYLEVDHSEGSEGMKFFHCLEYFSSLDLDLPWMAEAFQIVSNMDHLPNAEMIPHYVEVKAFGEPGPGQLFIWRGRKEESNNRYLRRSKTSRTRRSRQTSRRAGHSRARGRGRPGSAQSSRGRRKAITDKENAEVEGSMDGAPPLVDEEVPDSDGSMDSIDRIVGDEDVADAKSASSEESLTLMDLADQFMNEEIMTGEAPNEEDSNNPNPSSSSGMPVNQQSGPHVKAAPDPDAVRTVGVRAVGGPRVPREDQIEIPGFGDITFYSASATMVACCRQHHAKKACKKSKTVKGSQSFLRQGQGRPIGCLMAWLMEGKNHDDQHSHVHYGESTLTLAQRKVGRRQFFQLPGAERFMQYERALREHEEDEPEIVP